MLYVNKYNGVSVPCKDKNDKGKARMKRGGKSEKRRRVVKRNAGNRREMIDEFKQDQVPSVSFKLRRLRSETAGPNGSRFVEVTLCHLDLVKFRQTSV